MSDDQKRLAQAVREACVEAALRAYEEAGISGLCCEGRWEIAVDVMRNLILRRWLTLLTSLRTLARTAHK